MQDLIDLAIKFIEDHFDEIDKYVFSEDFFDEMTKDHLIELIKGEDKIYYSWVITELMRVGTNVNYLTPYICNVNENFMFIKVNGQCYKYIGSIDNSEPFEKITNID